MPRHGGGSRRLGHGNGGRSAAKMKRASDFMRWLATNPTPVGLGRRQVSQQELPEEVERFDTTEALLEPTTPRRRVRRRL